MRRNLSSLISTFVFGVLATSALFSAPSFAVDRAGQFGFMYGFSLPDAENVQRYTMSGIKGMAFVSPQHSFGGYMLDSDGMGQLDSNHEFKYSLQGLQAAWHFTGNTGDTFIGVRIGMTKIIESPSNNDMVFSPYHWGAVVGYDYAIYPWLTIGYEGSYIHVDNGTTHISGIKYYEESFNLINFLATIQFRL